MLEIGSPDILTRIATGWLQYPLNLARVSHDELPNGEPENVFESVRAAAAGIVVPKDFGAPPAESMTIIAEAGYTPQIGTWLRC
jgi:hypothetical protein